MFRLGPPKKKLCNLFLLTRPTLFFCADPKLFITLKKKNLEIKHKIGRKSTILFTRFCLHLTSKVCRKIIGEKYCDHLQLWWRILVWQSSQSESPCITKMATFAHVNRCDHQDAYRMIFSSIEGESTLSMRNKMHPHNG